MVLFLTQDLCFLWYHSDQLEHKHTCQLMIRKAVGPVNCFGGNSSLTFAPLLTVKKILYKKEV